MIQNFDCRGQRMMERIIADRQTIYNRVEFISWRNNTLALFLAWKSVASTIIVVCGYGTITKKKYRYESKKHYLFKHDNCAWIYSGIANIHLLGKYDNSPECAWNSLWNHACIHLGQYEKGKVVFSRAVEIYTPLGEFHPAWSVTDLESTIIVLGNI